jgi:uncharacterized damage-inducible protein DinB
MRVMMMDILWKTILWQQFGASIDMLENAIIDCPEKVWGDLREKPLFWSRSYQLRINNNEPQLKPARRQEFWYIAYHTLFFLDLYLSESDEGFTPPAPFGLSELDPAGALPERVYTKDELNAYLKHCYRKCRARIQSLTDEKARQTLKHVWIGLSGAEALIYTLRHVQHHAAQLCIILRQEADLSPRWVGRTKVELSGE